jgi:hypothetical protein
MKVINRVTLTGADDSIKPSELIEITDRHPYTEWGILLSKHNEGRNRFPTKNWMAQLIEVKKQKPNIQISAHLCGRWVRDVCEGNWAFFDEVPLLRVASRIQLNFHAHVHKITDHPAFIGGLTDARLGGKQIIFQLDNVNNGLLDEAIEYGINAAPLFDTSGGVGRLPDKWPTITPGRYTGYAGGLSPENLSVVMRDIEKVCGEGPIWIDVETLVRSRGDSLFDLEKCENFLCNSMPWLM